MTTDAPPSRDPSNDDFLAGMLAEVLNKFLASSIDDMLPCMVVVYDKAKNRVKVKPLIQVLTTDGQVVDRAEIQSIPVFQLGGGGYVLAFNKIKAGDLGWIKASDRDISLFLQSYEQAPPNTKRFHEFADALFFPDAMRGYDIVDGENVVLQSIDGKVKIALLDNSINILAGTVNISDNVKLFSNDIHSPEVDPEIAQAIARENDTVEVTFPAGTFSVGGTGSTPNLEVTLTGFIDSGSKNHTAN